MQTRPALVRDAEGGRRARNFMHGFVLLSVFVLTGCRGSSDAERCEGTSAQAIKIESAGALHPLAAARQHVLEVKLSDPDDRRELLAACSAARIAPGYALTAQHCVRDIERLVGWVRTPLPTPTSSNCDDDAFVNEPLWGGVEAHPALDLAILRFEDLSSAQRALTLEPSSPAPGTKVILAGYGLTESSSTGDLRAIEGVTLHHTDDDAFTIVQGDGGGACVGDSGGPLLRVGPEGTLTLLGILSRGSASCLGRDEYVRLDLARPWLDAHVPDIEWRVP